MGLDSGISETVSAIITVLRIELANIWKVEERGGANLLDELIERFVLVDGILACFKDSMFDLSV